MMTLSCTVGANGGFGQLGRGLVSNRLTPERNKLYGYVLKKVRNREVSEDIVQEVFVRVAAYQKNNSANNVLALGFRIALNLVRDYFRAQRPTAELDESLVCPEPLADEVLIQRQRLALVQEIIEQMPPLRREIFRRRRVEGESLADIAATLKMSPAAVEKHLVRGLADLNAAMSKSAGSTGGRR